MSTTKPARFAAALAAVGVAALLAISCAAETSRDPATGAGTSTSTSIPADAAPTAPAAEPEPTPMPTVLTVERDELGQLLEQLIVGTRLPAVGATTFTSDRIIETDVAGVRRVGYLTPVELTDKFSIGSNAKAMSAVMVATFVDEGVIGWNTTIGDVYGDTISDMDGPWATITLRQLLSHTAGLDDQTLFPALMDLDTNAPVKAQRRAALNTITATELERLPGEYAYSNIGYTIVGAMFEQLTGSAWEDLIQTRIFDPLEMDSCGFYAPGTAGQLDQPWGHFDELDGKAMDPGDPDADLPPVLAPTGMVHCNMADWVRFLQTQLRGFQGSTAELISLESFQAIQTPADGSDYALGWLIAPGPDEAVTFYHHGSNRRFTAEVWLDPSSDRGLITVTNIGGAIADQPLATINRALFNRRTTP